MSRSEGCSIASMSRSALTSVGGSRRGPDFRRPGHRGARLGGCWQTSRRWEVFFFKCFSLFLKERERQSMSGGGTEREGDTEFEAGSKL